MHLNQTQRFLCLCLCPALGKVGRGACSPCNSRPQLGAWHSICSTEPVAPRPAPPSPTAVRVLCCMRSAHGADTLKNKGCCFLGAAGLGARLQAPGLRASRPSSGSQFPEQDTLPAELTGAASEETSQGPRWALQICPHHQEWKRSPRSCLCSRGHLPSPWLLPEARI